MSGAIEVHLSWLQEGVIDFEAWPNAVIDAMYQTMQAPSNSQPNVPNSWGGGVLYGYDLAFSKSQIIWGGQGWRRTVGFNATFELLIP